MIIQLAALLALSAFAVPEARAAGPISDLLPILAIQAGPQAQKGLDHIEGRCTRCPSPQHPRKISFSKWSPKKHPEAGDIQRKRHTASYYHLRSKETATGDRYRPKDPHACAVRVSMFKRLVGHEIRVRAIDEKGRKGAILTCVVVDNGPDVDAVDLSAYGLLGLARNRSAMKLPWSKVTDAAQDAGRVEVEIQDLGFNPRSKYLRNYPKARAMGERFHRKLHGTKL